MELEIQSLSPKVKEYFALDNAARSWWDTSGHPRYDRQLDFVADELPVPGSSVLDVATGRGRFAVRYALSGARRILALDISNGMLDIAKSNVQKAGVQNRIDFVQADIEEHPLPEKHFDIVNCMEVYVHFPNPARVTRNLFCCLREGGLLVANIDLPQTRRWYFDWLNEPLRTLGHLTTNLTYRTTRYGYFKFVPRLARVYLSNRFGWPAEPRSLLALWPGRRKNRLDTTEETIEALKQDPVLKLSRAEDAINRMHLSTFLEMLTEGGFLIKRVVREARPFQLAYGYIVIAERPHVVKVISDELC